MTAILKIHSYEFERAVVHLIVPIYGDRRDHYHFGDYQTIVVRK